MSGVAGRVRKTESGNFERSLLFAIIAILVVILPTGVHAAGTASPQPPPSCRVPSVSPEDVYARTLLCNALQYVRPQYKIIDPESGYPVEGWNQEPQRKLFLRSFTQLTAIGQWLELLGNTIAGNVEVPWLGKEEAIAHLTRAVDSLRSDQHNPSLSDKGLLANFFDLSTRNRGGPLASTVEKRQLVEVFGDVKTEGLWQALKKKGWIEPQANGYVASIHRGTDYGLAFFDGPLKPYGDDPTKTKVMGILDQRERTIIFGDNANLSMSVAKTIGALLRSPRDDSRLAAIRENMEGFLTEQQPGYESLYDKKTGLFYFGWEAGKGRFFGWMDPEGQWHAGHMDYLVNEFRGPTTFVVLRYGFPSAPLANLGFHMMPYQQSNSQTLYVLAPWDGSAFQGFEFNLSHEEAVSPSWRRLLENFVEVELDYAQRHGLPGFLSESYTGVAAFYSGSVGIPAVSVNPTPRITDAASLYTLGVAYMVDRPKIERFLSTHWPTISTLLTEHGPWEGFNVTLKEPIQVQTSTHTFALILGLLGTGPENARRYFEAKGIQDRLADCYRPGQSVDLLAQGAQIYAWADDPNAIRSARQKDAFEVQTDAIKRLGMAFVSQAAEGMNLSGGLLRLRYRSAREIAPVSITFKPVGYSPASPLITKEVLTRLVKTGGAEQEIQVVLPATPGLKNIKEVVLTHEAAGNPRPITLAIAGFSIRPYQR